MRFTRQSIAALSLPLEKPEQVVWDDTRPAAACASDPAASAGSFSSEASMGKSTKGTLGSPDVVAPMPRAQLRASCSPAFESATTSRENAQRSGAALR
jgi:hypothetical protein